MQGPRVLGAPDDRPAPRRGGGDLRDELVLDGVLALGQREVCYRDAREESRPVVVDGAFPGPAGHVGAAHAAGPHGAALGIGTDETQLEPVQRRARPEVGDAVDVPVAVDLEGRAVPPHVADAGDEALRAGHVVDGVRHPDGGVPEVGQPHEQADAAAHDPWLGVSQLELVGRDELGGAALPDEVVGEAASRRQARDDGGVDVREVLAEHPHEGVGELLVAVVEDVEEQRHVEREDLEVVQPLALGLARALEELVDRGDRGHPVHEVAALGAALGDRLLGGLALAPEVHGLLDEVDRAGQEVRRDGEWDVLVVDAFGEAQPVLEEELAPEDLVPRRGVVEQ